MDILQDKIASTIEKYGSEFGKGLIQGAAASVSAIGAVCDGIQELRKDDYKNLISFYDQMELNRVGDKSLPRKVGEVASFTAGATVGFHNP